MSIHVYAYKPNDSDPSRTRLEEKFLFENLQLLLDHAETIVNNSDYFFCSLPFSWCSFLWVGGGGPLCLGHLLLGWHDGMLVEPCPDCQQRVLVTRFGGSPLSGSNSWSGFCLTCCEKKTGCDSVHKPFSNRVIFAVSLRKMFPQETSRWEEYDGSVFSWGGNGLQAAKKKRLVIQKTADAVALEDLIQDLKTGNIRKANPPHRIELQVGVQFELRFKKGSALTFPPQSAT